MNYYIQGCAAKADKIKAAFEDKGYNTTGWKFDVEGVFYYTHEGIIDLACAKFLINLIKTHPDYKELELPVEPKFKVGDWIVRSNGSSDIPIQVYGLKKDRYLVTNMLGSKGKAMLTFQDKWRLWSIADAKDGDVLVYPNEIYQDEILLFNLVDNNSVLYHCCFDGNLVVHSFYGFSNVELLDVHPATKEQRDLLFRKMKEAGYQWDADKKELRKIQPHYDIANFYAGMPVLVRPDNDCSWDYSVFSRNTGNEYWPFAVCNGVSFTQCIPYNDYTKHLLGTTDMPSEEYINW